MTQLTLALTPSLCPLQSHDAQFGMLNTIGDLSRPAKRVIAMGNDVILSVMATWAAYCMYFESWYRPHGVEWWIFLLAPAIEVSLITALGLYRAIFRYMGLHTLLMTARAVLISAVLLVGILHWQFWYQIPRSLGILQPLIFLLLVSASRVVGRLWLLGGGGNRDVSRRLSRLLIYGAGTVGVQTAAALAFSRQFKLLGFIDEDPAKVGQTINGVTVFSPTEVPHLVEQRCITDILLAIPNASRDRRSQIIRELRTLPVHTRTLPGLSDLASGKVTLQDFRELDVDDLLWRDAVKPQDSVCRVTQTDRSILVTGAGGSIGSELCRQILQDKPRRLVLLDHSEFALYALHHELNAVCQASGQRLELVPVLASVTDRSRLDRVLQTSQPDTIYHAAAYKHVPMVECNPAISILNNVFGTLNVAQAAQAAGVQRLVLVSTDKAVRPTNIMGASKRMAELILQALAAQSGRGHTCLGMVRFGNVLGSSGSVIPLFRSQLAHGGPLTLTHPQVTRYFMTIPEAVQLVLQAGDMAQGGEVFVLEMGQPVKIIDLAYRLVQLSGLQVRDDTHPEGDIEIRFIGLRPGEKLYEELLIGNNPSPTLHPRIMKAHEEFIPWDILQGHLAHLEQAANADDLPAMTQVLQTCVSGFHPSPS